jgi:hypothetical protein
MSSRRDGGMRVPAGPGRGLRVHCPTTSLAVASGMSLVPLPSPHVALAGSGVP